MNKRLLMFTNNYPYGTGETFIESEIEIASQYYEEVLIFVRDPLNTQNPRKVPSNVFVVVPRKKNRIQKIFSYMYSVVMGILNGDLLREWSKQKKSFLYIKKSTLFYCEAMDKYRQFIMFVPQEGDITYYSYWFMECAYIAMKMREQFHEKDAGFVTRAHGYDLYKERASLGYFPFRDIMMEEINKIFPCSKIGVKELESQFPQYKEKYQCSYLGTRPGDKSTVIHQKKASFIIATCSYIRPIKRVKRLAETLALMENAGIGNEIVWVCFGDGELKEELQEYCEKNLKRIKVIFKGHCDNSEVLKFYEENQVDLFVNLSVLEGVPVSIMEALAFGIPAIATNVGGTAEVVKEGISGFLINKDFTNQELMDKVLKIINMSQNEKRCLDMSAKEYWEKNFDFIDNYRDFYETLSSI